MKRLMIPIGVVGGLAALSPHAGATEFLSQRHVYIRGEQASFQIALSPGVDAVKVDISGWLSKSLPVRVADGGGLEATYSFDTNQLRPGDYDVRAEPLRLGQAVEKATTFTVTIAATPNPQRFPVWNWSIPETRNLAWWKERGFTGFRLPEAQDPTYSTRLTQLARTYLEEGARQGFDVGMTMNPLRSATLAKSAASEGRNAKVYPRNPIAIEHAEKTTDNFLNKFKEYPALRFALLSSEYQIPPMDSKLWRELVEKEAGLPAGQIPQQEWFFKQKNVYLNAEKLPPELQPNNGIIEDDNLAYRYLQWWWQRGHGTSLLNQDLHKRIKAVRPDILTWHDPYRLSPVRNSHTGLDMVSTWTYGHPDIKRLGYTAVLQAAARPEKQKVMQTISLFMYDRFVRPLNNSTADLLNDQTGDDESYNQGPDYSREAMWLVMSQRPDVLGFFYAVANSPDKTQLDPYVTSPETFDAIGEVSRSLIEPYGPVILKSQREPAKVAVLMSASALWFNGTLGWANEAILPFTGLLMMNHVPFDVLLDEDILEGKLENYDAVVIPNGEVLPRGVHRRIAEFARGGKRVIADKSLAADIPGAKRTNFDFAFVKLVDGTQVATGKAVTADYYRTKMEQYADELKPLVAGLQGTIKVESKRILTNTLQSGEVQYAFVINDNKAYGPRFGQWGLHHELGMRQQTDVMLSGAAGKAVYDALERREIMGAPGNGGLQLKTILPASRGKLMAILPEKIGKLEMTVTPNVARGTAAELRVRVLGDSGAAIKGSLPLQIQVMDATGKATEYCRYGATSPDGSGYALSLLPAINDQPGKWTIRVTDYLSGQRVEGEMAVN